MSRDFWKISVPVALSTVVSVHIMKVQLHPFLTSALDGSKCSVSRPGRFITRKLPWYPPNWGLGGSHSQSGRFGKEKYRLLLPGFEPQIVQPVACSLYRHTHTHTHTYIYIYIVYIKTSAACLVIRERTNLGRRVAQASNFVGWRLILVGPRNLLHITLLAPRILRWLLDFGKLMHPARQCTTAKLRVPITGSLTSKTASQNHLPLYLHSHTQGFTTMN
jgi:hypothetical protein